MYAFLLPKTKLLHLPSVRLQEKQAPPTFMTGTLSDGYILLLGDQQKIQKKCLLKKIEKGTDSLLKNGP